MRSLVGSLVGKLHITIFLSCMCGMICQLHNSPPNDPTNNQTNWIWMSKKIGLKCSFTYFTQNKKQNKNGPSLAPSNHIFEKHSK